MKKATIALLAILSAPAIASPIKIGTWHVFAKKMHSNECKNPSFVTKANAMDRDNSPDPYHLYKQNSCMPAYSDLENPPAKFKVVKALKFGSHTILEIDQPTILGVPGKVVMFDMYVDQNDVNPKNVPPPTRHEMVGSN